MKSCSNCYYADDCEETRVCRWYTPLDEEPTDEEVERWVRNRKKEYYNEYARYVSQYEDDLFFW